MLLPHTVFAMAYAAIASERFPRHLVALLGGGLLIVLGVLSPVEALGYINGETLGLLGHVRAGVDSTRGRLLHLAGHGGRMVV